MQIAPAMILRAFRFAVCVHCGTAEVNGDTRLGSFVARLDAIDSVTCLG